MNIVEGIWSDNLRAFKILIFESRNLDAFDIFVWKWPKYLSKS